MFEGFETFDIAASGTTIHGRQGGNGPPLLLLHGIPETHLMWHRAAPQLSQHFNLVVTDLRGYGESGKPASSTDHSLYSMRELARDQVEVMRALGFETFALAGHDRGARCAYRLALDYPGVVSRLALLDIIPTGEVFRRADLIGSPSFWIWHLLSAPYPIPEKLIAPNVDLIVNSMLDTWSDDPRAFPADVREEYISRFSPPETIHAICEEYRAASTLDRIQDEQDRGTKRIACPLLALWSHSSGFAGGDGALAPWREWADDVRGAEMACGHFLPEEAPDETAERLIDFLVP